MLGNSFSLTALAVNQRRAASPAAAGAAAWYDPSDRSTLFQDAAMTIPVTADGNPVGAILDRSGNGHRFLQATAAKKPVYRTDGILHWIESDGVDDIMIGTHRFGLATNPALTVTAGLRFETMNAGIVMAIGDEATYGMLNPGIGVNGMSWRHGNGASAFGDIASGADAVLSWHRAQNAAYQEEKFARNGVEMPLIAIAGGTLVPTNTGAKTALFGQDAAAAGVKCRLYALVVLASDDATKRAIAEAWVAARSGVAP